MTGLVVSALLLGCGDPSPPAPAYSPSPADQAVLTELNRIAGNERAERSFQYALAAPCRLTIRKLLAGKPYGESSVPLAGMKTEILGYLGREGFGLKGYPPGDLSGVDLLDSRTESTSRRAAELISEQPYPLPAANVVRGEEATGRGVSKAPRPLSREYHKNHLPLARFAVRTTQKFHI